jgi:hypothetical protein
MELILFIRNSAFKGLKGVNEAFAAGCRSATSWRTRRSFITQHDRGKAVRATQNGQSSPVNCCWSSPAQSFLVSGPVDHIFVLSKFFLRVLKWGLLFDERRGLTTGHSPLYCLCHLLSLPTQNVRDISIYIII